MPNTDQLWSPIINSKGRLPSKSNLWEFQTSILEEYTLFCHDSKEFLITTIIFTARLAKRAKVMFSLCYRPLSEASEGYVFTLYVCPQGGGRGRGRGGSQGPIFSGGGGPGPAPPPPPKKILNIFFLNFFFLKKFFFFFFFEKKIIIIFFFFLKKTNFFWLEKIFFFGGGKWRHKKWRHKKWRHKNGNTK